MKCKELQIGDWIQDENGSPMRIIKVGRDYVCAIFGDNECPWAFEDDDVQPEGIPITPEILEKNGWWFNTEDMWLHDEVDFDIEKWDGRFQCYEINQIKLDSVHELQHALRLCGLDELADNFKV